MAKKKSPQKTPKNTGLSLSREHLLERLEPLQEAVLGFEKEAQVLVKKLRKQGQKTRKEILKGLEDILGKVRGIEILNRASKKRSSLEKEIKSLAEDLVANLKEIEKRLGGELLGETLSKVQETLEDIKGLLVESPWLSKVKGDFKQGRAEVYRLLSLPSQKEIERLGRKVLQLEKKVVRLSRQAA